MARSFRIFLAERPDVRSTLEPLGWKPPAAGQVNRDPVDPFELQGRDWDAYLLGPTNISWEDALPEASALQAGIAWYIEVALKRSEIHGGCGG
jgi:hypothetical protein